MDPQGGQLDILVNNAFQDPAQKDAKSDELLSKAGAWEVTHLMANLPFIGGLNGFLIVFYQRKFRGRNFRVTDFRMSGKELVKERGSEGKSQLGKELIVTFRLSGKELVKGRVS